MDAYEQNNITLNSDISIKQKRSYKMDYDHRRTWCEFLNDGKLACILTVENLQVAEHLGSIWVDTGIIQWAGFFYDGNAGLIIC